MNAVPRKAVVRRPSAKLLEARTAGRFLLGSAVAAGMLGGVFGLAGKVLDQQPPAPPTAETRSVCTSAYTNVSESLKLGIRSPVLLEGINPEPIDRQCGEEVDIAKDILDGEK